MKTNMLKNRKTTTDVIFNRNFCIAGNMFVIQCLNYTTYILHSITREKIEEVKQSQDSSFVEMNDDNAVQQLIWEYGLYNPLVSLKEGIKKTLEQFKYFLRELDDEFYSELTFVPKTTNSNDVSLLELLKEWNVQANLTLSSVKERDSFGEYNDEYTFILGILLTMLKDVIEKIESSYYLPF